jgi:hypothetical protein
MSHVSRIASTFALVIMTLVFAPRVADAQFSYARAQSVSPAFEGWEEEADGSKFFLFGYMNRNWEEELNVPVGPENMITPGEADQGQPTRFFPRRNRFVFRLPVPKNFTEKDELVWTLTANGVTQKAFATLRADYKVDTMVKQSESGALGGGTTNPEVRDNHAPVAKLQGPRTMTAVVGQPITLTMLVTDDGVPKPRPSRSAVSERESGASATSASASSRAEEAAQRAVMVPPVRPVIFKFVGLHLSWIVYRGAGDVTFDPVQTETWEDGRVGSNSPFAPSWTPPEMPKDGKVVVHATFKDPGVYTLRGLADDGALTSYEDVVVTVRGASSSKAPQD